MGLFRVSARVLVLAGLMAVAALGGAGCGGTDDADSASGDAAVTQRDPKEVRDAMRDLQDAYYAGEGDEFCAGLTETAAQATADGDKRLKSKAKSCEAMIRKAMPNPLPASMVERYRAEILGVTVDGNRATVKTKQTDDGPPVNVPFVFEDGKWKMDQGLYASSNKS